MNSLEELNEKFDFDALSDQLNAVLGSKDPIGYMNSNMNWEIDKDLENTNELRGAKSLISETYSLNIDYERWNPLRKFLEWLDNSRKAKQVKKTLCTIAAELQKLIDEEAEMKKLITLALTALAGVIGIASINAVVLTLLVGLLATMVLKGIANFCDFAA